jgi:GNAT superfamily N-acetyltransferase
VARASFNSLSPADARELDRLMAAEPHEYLRYFSAFQPPKTLSVQLASAVKDHYAAIRSGGALAGFYCLRGLDEGYDRPSFGIYVASSRAGEGWARLALNDAFAWCRRHGLSRVMLKVYPENTAAYKIYVEQGFVDIGRSPDSQRMMEKVLT